MKSEYYIQLLQNLFENELKNCIINDTISKLKTSSSIIIYGAGAGGLYSKYLLSLVDLPVFAFFDANANKIEEIEGIDVFIPGSKILSDEDKKSAFVIIGVGNQKAKKEIEQTLRLDGYANIISYIELFNEVFLMADDSLASAINAEFYYENSKDIFEGLLCFEDQQSCDIYCGFIKGHALKNNEWFPSPDNDDKYFPSEINFGNAYKCFIDCGATQGETYRSLVKHNINPEVIVMFEPDRENFSSLINTMETETGKALLYPCAVYSKTEMRGFFQSGTQGSSVSNKSKELVQCVALDEVLHNVNPTFIKMDIEGAEYEALKGAKRIIKANKPNLAICVYHAINHIWDIPILLKKMNPEYKFYLRSGNIFGMNTVLYAVSN